MHKYTN